MEQPEWFSEGYSNDGNSFFLSPLGFVWNYREVKSGTFGGGKHTTTMYVWYREDLIVSKLLAARSLSSPQQTLAHVQDVHLKALYDRVSAEESASYVCFSE